MTKIEKIDYIREKLPEYRKTSILFDRSEKQLDEIIERINGKKSKLETLKEENEKLKGENFILKQKIIKIKELLCQEI